MLTADTFKAEIESFLSKSGMTPTAFGRAVVSDPNFVRDVRLGRMPSLRLVEKVQTYIHQHEAAPEREGAAS